MLTFPALGTSARALGNFALRVFCTMDAVRATPQTLPNERIKYTVDAETA